MSFFIFLLLFIIISKYFFLIVSNFYFLENLNSKQQKMSSGGSSGVEKASSKSSSSSSKYTVSTRKARSYMKKYGLSEKEFAKADAIFKKYSRNGLFNFNDFNRLNQGDLSTRFTENTSLEFTSVNSPLLDFDEFVPMFKLFFKYV